MAALIPEHLIKVLTRLSIGKSPQASGTLKGESLSRHSGTSIEFQDYREYEPGDDFRSIDWSIYDRLGKLFVKRYAEEKSRPITFLLDTSSSMSLGHPSKERYARSIVAALGFVALWSGDEMRFANVSDDLTWRTPELRGRKRIHELFQTLEKEKSEGITHLEAPLSLLARQKIKPGGTDRNELTVLVSDMFDPDAVEALERLSHLPGQKVLIHLIAPDDIRPVGSGNFHLTDIETGEAIPMMLDDESLSHYYDLADAWIENIKQTALSCEIHCFTVETSLPLETLILRTLRQGGLLT